MRFDSSLLLSGRIAAGGSTTESTKFLLGRNGMTAASASFQLSKRILKLQYKIKALRRKHSLDCHLQHILFCLLCNASVIDNIVTQHRSEKHEAY